MLENARIISVMIDGEGVSKAQLEKYGQMIYNNATTLNLENLNILYSKVDMGAGTAKWYFRYIISVLYSQEEDLNESLIGLIRQTQIPNDDNDEKQGIVNGIKIETSMADYVRKGYLPLQRLLDNSKECLDSVE